MGWLSFLIGFVLFLILISMVASVVTLLLVAHQTCTPTSTSTGGSSQLFGSVSSSTASNATIGAAAPFVPVPMVAGELVLTPLAHLSLTKGNASTLSDLGDSAYWKEVHASEFQTYEQIIPQTVIGFFNSNEEWKAWALQHFPDSPGWLATGFVTEAQGQVLAVDPSSIGRREGSTATERGINDFAASAAGVTLASLDFVSFNGITAIKTLFETNDSALAVCQTLPGQLAQLYESSFDPRVPRDVRAQYLGRALAMTSVMLLVGGKDGFAGHFKTAIDGVGLGDSWPAVKPYLGDIASKASARASSATFAILQTLAQRFPQDSTFVTGFTADRVDSMVGVLHEKGVSDGVIQGDIQKVAQAAGTASDEQATGEVADASSLQHGGGMLVKVKTGNKIVLYNDANGRTANIRGTFLQEVIPGFDPRGPDFVQIHYEEAGVTVYHYYEERKVILGVPFKSADTEWNPRVPDVVGKPGDIVTVSFDLLTTDKFLKSVPPIAYINAGRVSWVSDFSEMKSLQLAGDQVQMSVQQEPLQGVSSFTVDGTPGSLDNSNGDTFLKFSIPNVVDEPRMLKITFDGYGKPILSISSSSNFNPITHISSDGVRLRIVSNSGGSARTISTLYLQQPSVGWKLGAMNDADLGFTVSGAYKTYKIDQVSGARPLEDLMTRSFSKPDLGRVGAEIAYTVAQQKFHLDGVRLYEITKGGKDLDTRDGAVVIQARMLANPDDLSAANLQATLSGQMNDLVVKLQQDFANNPATTGYAILSYLNPSTQTVSTLIAEVLRQ